MKQSIFRRYEGVIIATIMGGVMCGLFGVAAGIGAFFSSMAVSLWIKLVEINDTLEKTLVTSLLTLQGAQIIAHLVAGAAVPPSPEGETEGVTNSADLSTTTRN